MRIGEQGMGGYSGDMSTQQPVGAPEKGIPEQDGTSAQGPARQRFGAKGWQVTLVWVACIAVVAGIAAAFGGFEARTDKGVAAQAGEAVALNAVEVRVRDASVKSSEGAYWVVTVQADVTNTSGQPLTGSDLDSAVQFGYVNGESQEVRTGYSSMYILDSGGFDQSSPRQVIPPTGQSFSVVFTVSITDGFEPGHGISVGLFPVVYKQNIVLGLSYQKYWVEDQDADHYWIVTLPVA